jgi:hypothetical protein
MGPTVSGRCATPRRKKPCVRLTTGASHGRPFGGEWGWPTWLHQGRQAGTPTQPGASRSLERDRLRLRGLFTRREAGWPPPMISPACAQL